MQEPLSIYEFIVQDTFNTPDGQRTYPVEVKLKRPDGSEEIWGTQRLLDEIERIRQETMASFYGDPLPTDKDSVVGKIINRTRELLDSAVEVQDIYSDDKEKGVELVRIPKKDDDDFESATIYTRTSHLGGRDVVITSIELSENEPLWVKLDGNHPSIHIDNSPQTQALIVREFKARIAKQIGTESELRIFDTRSFPSIEDQEYFMDSLNSQPDINYGHPVAINDLPLVEACWRMLEPSEKVHVEDMNAGHENQASVEPEVTGPYHDMLMKQIREEKKITDPTPPDDKI